MIPLTTAIQWWACRLPIVCEGYLSYDPALTHAHKPNVSILQRTTGRLDYKGIVAIRCVSTKFILNHLYVEAHT